MKLRTVQFFRWLESMQEKKKNHNCCLKYPNNWDKSDPHDETSSPFLGHYCSELTFPCLFHQHIPEGCLFRKAVGMLIKNNHTWYLSHLFNIEVWSCIYFLTCFSQQLLKVLNLGWLHSFYRTLSDAEKSDVVQSVVITESKPPAWKIKNLTNYSRS